MGSELPSSAIIKKALARGFPALLSDTVFSRELHDISTSVSYGG